MQLEHVLVGVDFSEASREAVRTAARLAGPRTRLTLVYVWHAQHPYTAFSGDELRNAVAEDETKMIDLAAEARALGAAHVNHVFLAGNAAAEIIELAHKDESIDLIVVGTHGRTGLAHVFLGSVAEKIVRRAPCAVMTVPAPGLRDRKRSARAPANASIH